MAFAGDLCPASSSCCPPFLVNVKQAHIRPCVCVFGAYGKHFPQHFFAPFFQRFVYVKLAHWNCIFNALIKMIKWPAIPLLILHRKLDNYGTIVLCVVCVGQPFCWVINVVALFSVHSLLAFFQSISFLAVGRKLIKLQMPRVSTLKTNCCYRYRYGWALPLRNGNVGLITIRLATPTHLKTANCPLKCEEMG